MFKLLCTAVLCGTSMVHAQTSDASKSGNTEAKPYVQGSLGLQRFDSPSSTGMAMDLNGRGSGSTNNSVRATVGVQFTEHLGVEGTFYALRASTLHTVSGDATYHGQAHVLSLAASMPVRKDVNVVGRVGLGRSDIDVSVPSTTYTSNSSQNLIVWGLGVRYALDPSKDLTFDYDNLGATGKYALGDRVKTEMISLGLRFKF